ncbi:hypothetical protein [uncultured Psychrobacter sp.]|uniref:hypothetical protein n=1 Tax=uncultured Psychrobacter sp. TaxID=259303 RepID=UPI003459D09B
MKNIDRFNMGQAVRVQRCSKIIYYGAKYGAKGISKVNPALVFIDAVISLADLFVSYSAYRQVKEQNKQLMSQIETLKHEFKNLRKELDLSEEKYRYQLEKDRRLIQQKLENNKQNLAALKLAYEHARDYFMKMKEEVEYYRKELPFAKETREIVSKYHEVVTIYVSISLEYVGG